MPRIFLPTLLAFVVSLSGLVRAGEPVKFSVKLPTPLEHYKTYDPDKAALELMGKIMNELDPQSRALVMKFMQSGKGPAALPKVSPEQALAMIKKMGLYKYKGQLIDIFLHKSQVLELVPKQYQDTLLPIVHDALLAFIDGLSDERLAERLYTMSRVPPDTPRGEKILILASKLPALQKLGQIIARADFIPPDVQKYLVTLENGVSTMTRDELVADIRRDVGDELIEKYQMRFADKILAEASVGAVIKATFVRPGETERREMVCKLIKPYVRTGLPHEMDIIDGLIRLVGDHQDFYHIKGIPLQELFNEIKEKLGEELRVTQEQANFRRAYAFYANDPGVRVPEVYDFSTDNVTFMEFLHGEKITDAFRGDQEKRSIMAKRMVKLMSYDSLFSKQPVAIFHGDPHAGNVMHVTDDPKNPYVIGLIDWGLLGEFDRPHRIEMVHLSLAVKHRNKKMLRKNVGALIKGGLPRDPAKLARVRELTDKCLEQKKNRVADSLAQLVEDLTKSGFLLDSNLSLYIKSQVTLAGIFTELDPELKSDKYVEKLVGKQVRRELPKRLLFLPAYKYRGYRSLLSNGDVLREVF